MLSFIKRLPDDARLFFLGAALLASLAVICIVGERTKSPCYDSSLGVREYRACVAAYEYGGADSANAQLAVIDADRKGAAQ